MPSRPSRIRSARRPSPSRWQRGLGPSVFVAAKDAARDDFAGFVKSLDGWI
ncbi:hypothetical protein [Streptomyces capitiformicae]|uniref:hypothetical protein n=1 Tax=Streptomyces capitiformicae TaxID=2014920 RepID=UPI001678CF79|nr:hypothetical protein [Streptomyces capitiformicae]